MKMKFIAGAVLAMSIGATAPAFAAEKGNEASFSYSDVTIKPEGGDSFNFTLLDLTYGRYLSDQLLVTGSWRRVEGEGFENNQFGIGAKYYLQVGKKSELVPFVEAGLALGSTSGDGFDSDETGLMIGAGVSYFMTETTSIDARYQIHKLTSESDGEEFDVDVNMLLIGMTHRF